MVPEKEEVVGYRIITRDSVIQLLSIRGDCIRCPVLDEANQLVTLECHPPDANSSAMFIQLDLKSLDVDTVLSTIGAYMCPMVSSDRKCIYYLRIQKKESDSTEERVLARHWLDESKVGDVLFTHDQPQYGCG